MIAITKRFRAFSTTINPDEILKFARASSEWWDPKGQFNVYHLSLHQLISRLHRMNPVRVKYIADNVSLLNGNTIAPLSSLTMLDVGCGGGLLSEVRDRIKSVYRQSLARLGADVTAVDAAEENIKMASFHASLDPSLKDTINYRAVPAEHLVEEGKLFDVVCALEIIEHVADKDLFIASLAKLTKPGGMLFISTMNRTPLASFLTVTMAEYILRMVPPGTHDHTKYCTPDELRDALSTNGCQVLNMAGMHFNPLTNQWALAHNTPLELQVNYILTAIKK